MLLSWAGRPEVGRAACLRSTSAFRFAAVAQHHSTLLLEWVVSPFDDLSTGRWAFDLNLVPSGSTDRICNVRLVLEPFEHVILLQ